MKNRSEEFGIWNLLTWVAMGLFLLAASVVVVSLWYMPVIQKNEGMRQEIIALKEKIAREREVARQLGESINALQTDPEAVERQAREALGYAGPDESVVRIIEEDGGQE